ncbi:MAG: hypothetical protein RIS92_1972 [Verrucomicrobiota bacterium]|jgi:hypothetical protein
MPAPRSGHTSRRIFLATSLSAAIAGLAAAESRPRRIVLRSSWQTVNIGDIAHTPGVLALLEKHLPEVEVRLWPSSVKNGVAEMLLARFPKLQIIQTPEALKAAFNECDFLLHGSGPSLVAAQDIAKWRDATGKPYGVYGITFNAPDAATAKAEALKKFEQTIPIMSGARFVFFRDSVSLAEAKKRGCTCPVMGFGPDGAFATDLRDDARAIAFLRAHHLEEGRFLCCIPRLRYTPYWTVPSRKTPLDETKHARNESMKERDHRPLREAIVEVVRETTMKVLICPEDETQMALGKEMVFDKLPDDVKAKVVLRPDFWLTSEALSTYTRSAGLFGAEMHSPIMCIGNGIPAIVIRWEEQTSKGIMWRDIGLGEWLFNLDEVSEIPGIVPAVLALAKDPAAAKAKAMKARASVIQRQRETMQTLSQSL